MQHFDLEKFAQGKLSAQINKALERVTENVQDPNTDPEKVRKIVATITLRPNAERNYVATAVEVKTTLAPEIGAVTALNMGRDLRTGKVDCVEIANQIPGQLSVEDITEETEKEEPVTTFDPDTGEIFEPSNNVVNLRSRQA